MMHHLSEKCTIKYLFSIIDLNDFYQLYWQMSGPLSRSGILSMIVVHTYFVIKLFSIWDIG